MRASFRISRALRCFVCLALGLQLLLVSAGRTGYAQRIIPRRGLSTQSSDPSDAFPTNHKLARQLLTAQEELAAKNYKIGLRRLGLILGAEGTRRSTDTGGAGEDFFFTATPEDISSFRSLKSTALELIAKLPPEGLKAYEELYGRQAQVQLQAATAPTDLEGIADVSRRFFHTFAGYEAVYLLATHHMDHSRPLAAARGFARLRQYPSAAVRWNPTLLVKEAICWSRIGQAGKSAELLALLRQDHPQAAIELGGEQLRLFGESKAEQKALERLFSSPPPHSASDLEQWTMYGGNPTRNAAQVDVFPLVRPRWQIPTVDNTAVREIVADWEQLVRQAGDLSIPAVQPLIVDGKLIVKTVGDKNISTGSKIRAVNLQNGDILWQTSPDAGFDPMPPKPNMPGASPASVPNLVRDTVTNQRVWHDQTFGNLTSDGRLVFSVEELGAFRPSRQALSAPLRPFNILRAYAVLGGKAEWEIGGPPGSFTLPMAGTFFLGPPLPMGGLLYCLGEQNRQVKLIVLDADSGEFQWSQNLATVNSDNRSLSKDFWRRVTGIGPAFSQGILVCPTGVGGIIGVDLENRSLLWHYLYRDERGVSKHFNKFRFAPFQLRLLPGQDGNHWLDSTPIIATDRILITPRDAPELYCLDLLTGKLLWRKPKLDRLQIAGVMDQKAIVVGRGEIEFFRMDDGSPELREPIILPPPSGRAVLAGGKLLVPLSTAELLSVDVEHGRVVGRTPLRSGVVPGNLLCHREMIVSVGTDSISGFDDLEHAEESIRTRLAKNPDDGNALLARAEILFQKGELAQAAADLRRILGQNDERSTRELLRDVLLAGMKTDFATFRGSIDEIETLLGSPDQEIDDILKNAQTDIAFHYDEFSKVPGLFAAQEKTALYLRRLGRGQAAAGDVPAALDAFFRYASSEDEHAFDKVDSTVAVRRDRWFGAQISGLMKTLPVDQRKEIDQRVEAELAAALKPLRAEALRQFLTRYGSHPAATKARRAMVDALAEGVGPLESEFALLRLHDSKDQAQVAYSTAKLASLLLDAERISEATRYLHALESRWADTVALNGKTGQELVASWRRDDPRVEREFSVEPLWPTGSVKVLEQPNSNRPPVVSNRVIVVETRNSPDRPLSLHWHSKSRTLSATNGLTDEVWKLTLEGQGRSGAEFRTPYARVNGNLTLLMAGAKIIAIDTLGWNGEHQARVLWDKTLVDPYRSTGNPSFSQNFTAIDRRGRGLGMIGPVTEDSLFYQEGRTIVAVEPLTGERLWQRSGFDYRSGMFADEDRLMVVAPQARTARFYARIDGSFLGARPYLSGLQQIAVWDGHMIGLQYSDEKLSILSRHVWTGKDDWNHEFSNRSLYTRVGHNELAVLQPDGRFAIVNIHDGSLVIETKIKPELESQSIAVQASAENYVLIVNHPTEARTKGLVQRRSRWDVLVNGTVHGIDRRSGTPRWSRQISNQAIDLNQPSDLPILTFSSRVSTKPRTPQSGFELVCLDKRTGEIAFKPEPSRNGVIFGYQADVENKTVQIDLIKSSIQLTFNAEPSEEKPKPQEAQP